MTAKYLYKGMDLTLDIFEEMELVVSAIAKKEGISFEEAFLLFAQSRTCWCLQTPATAMWGENTEFIVDEFYREQKAG